MHVGWIETLVTPLKVIFTDLEMMEIEAKYSQAPPTPQKNKIGLHNANVQ